MYLVLYSLQETSPLSNMAHLIKVRNYRSNEEWYFDNHTLFLKFDGYGDYAPKTTAIAQAVQDAIDVYNTEHSDAPVTSTINVFMLKNKSGCLGTACVHLSNSAVYHMLRGCNADGSPRIVYQEPDVPVAEPSSPESWQEFPKPLQFSSEILSGTAQNHSGSPRCAISDGTEQVPRHPLDGSSSSVPILDTVKPSAVGVSSWADIDSSSSWTDISEREQPINRSLDWATLSEQELPAPKHMKVAVTLEPLMTLSDILRTEEELEAYNRIKGHYPATDRLAIDVDIAGVRKSVVSNPDREKSMSVLTGLVPEWITAKILYEAFKVYVSDSTTPHPYCDGPKVCNTPYPHVKLIREKQQMRAFIAFDPTTLDGSFAGLISKHFPISSGDKSGEFYFGSANSKMFRSVISELENTAKPAGGNKRTSNSSSSNGGWVTKGAGHGNVQGRGQGQFKTTTHNPPRDSRSPAIMTMPSKAGKMTNGFSVFTNDSEDSE